MERSFLGHAVAGELREFPAVLRIWTGAGDGTGFVYPLSRFRSAARRAGARVERRAPGGAAHAAIAAYPVQPAAFDPRTYRMGSKGRPVDGGAAGRSAAAFTQRRRTRFFAAGR